MDLTNIRSQKEYFGELRKIRKIIPDAIIAGGVIRDLYHKKYIKDIDIFIPSEITTKGHDVFTLDFWEDIFELNFKDGVNDDIDCPNDAGDYDINTIEFTCTATKNNIPYNIIVVGMEPIKYVETYFDIGLCKAYSDGMKLRYTSDFMKDSRNKTLTIVSECMDEDEFARMMKNHVPRMMKKYPNYPLVVPDMYKDEYIKHKRKTK